MKVVSTCVKSFTRYLGGIVREDDFSIMIDRISWGIGESHVLIKLKTRQEKNRTVRLKKNQAIQVGTTMIAISKITNKTVELLFYPVELKGAKLDAVTGEDPLPAMDLSDN